MKRLFRPSAEVLFGAALAWISLILQPYSYQIGFRVNGFFGLVAPLAFVLLVGISFVVSFCVILVGALGVRIAFRLRLGWPAIVTLLVVSLWIEWGALPNFGALSSLAGYLIGWWFSIRLSPDRMS